MNTEEIYKVVQKLVGNINPIADSAIDSVRGENLDVFIGVFDLMDTELKNIAFDNRNTRFGSVNAFVVKINNYYKRLKDCSECLEEKTEYNAKLISGFMAFVKQETGHTIPDTVFEKFFNA